MYNFQIVINLYIYESFNVTDKYIAVIRKMG